MELYGSKVENCREEEGKKCFVEAVVYRFLRVDVFKSLFLGYLFWNVVMCFFLIFLLLEKGFLFGFWDSDVLE